MTYHSIIKYGTTPILALVIVASHFYFFNQGLSSWKGGGFGMYTTYNPSQAQVYINGVEYKEKPEHIKEGNYVLNNFLFFPNQDNLLTLVQNCENPTDSLTIQIWYPHVNAKNSTFSRQLVHEFKYVKSN
ncbi:hypothetical protein [Flavobacterium tegetincola]|uniref:hypothetical protein n=1 Tax=Flavobacterium tegetincola TaxID=150172 RepID=UPI00040D7847|nr:hypothetical protein [Flavobacterium tegetincola]